MLLPFVYPIAGINANGSSSDLTRLVSDINDSVIASPSSRPPRSSMNGRQLTSGRQRTSVHISGRQLTSADEYLTYGTTYLK